MSEQCYVMSEDAQDEFRSAVAALRAIVMIACESKATIAMDDLTGLLWVLKDRLEHALGDLKFSKAA